MQVSYPHKVISPSVNGVYSEAKIILTLRNRGMEGYKPDEYGNSIIVSRKISKDGVSEYQLKNSSGDNYYCKPC